MEIDIDIDRMDEGLSEREFAGLPACSPVERMILSPRPSTRMAALKNVPAESSERVTFRQSAASGLNFDVRNITDCACA
jgi:hypothetical protein